MAVAVRKKWLTTVDRRVLVGLAAWCLVVVLGNIVSWSLGIGPADSLAWRFVESYGLAAWAAAIFVAFFLVDALHYFAYRFFRGMPAHRFVFILMSLYLVFLQAPAVVRPILYLLS